MNKLTFTLIFLVILWACQSKKTDGGNLHSDINEEALKSTRQIMGAKYKSHQIEEDQLGNLYVKFDSAVAVVKKAEIITGKLNEDSIPDAVVSYVVVHGNSVLSTNHLILINENNSFHLFSEIQKEMKVQKIENRIIYTEQSKISYDSPNFGCKSCIFVVKYKLSGDSLMIVK